ncbi:MAG: ATP-binding protein [Actinomycetota bacterium]
MSLPRDAVSVPVVRHICRDALKTLGVEGSCIEDIELAVTEACTNVLKHASDSDGAYEVEVKLDETFSTIRVMDRGSGFADSGTVPTTEEPSEGGRGIHLMKALVDDLRFSARPERGTVLQLEKGLVLKQDSILQRLGSLS